MAAPPVRAHSALGVLTRSNRGGVRYRQEANQGAVIHQRQAFAAAGDHHLLQTIDNAGRFLDVHTLFGNGWVNDTELSESVKTLIV